jgi:ATP-binding cassette, subfamily B, bacterial
VTAQISGIFSSIGLIDQHAPFLANYFDFLNVQPLIQVPAHPAALPSPLRGGIELKDVVFRYPGAERPAIDRFDLHIREGEMVALVGDNGAGKTTLLKLLLRFYDPQGGSVRVGGVDVKDLPPKVLRDRFGVLFQDYTNFSLRVRDSVAAGRVAVPPTDAAIWTALESAQADQIVHKLPQGLDNYVGRSFENGKDLSGGEWQRLALARLMYRDADVWILDEPTSSLDPEAEAAIFAELKQQLHGRIGIVISHRFSTVRIADRIAVIQDGRIAELGSHDQLMALGGRYAQLFELQAAAYR